MKTTDANAIIPDQPSRGTNDGIDRRNFLSCMAWAGTGMIWTLAGGIPTSRLFAADRGHNAAAEEAGTFSFVQISDSHIGFNKAANPDVTGTLKKAIDKINREQAEKPGTADFMIHTGDISHSAKEVQFDTAEQVIKEARIGRTFYVPGEHDIEADNGALFRERYGRGTVGGGWYSFDHKGVHFMGLNNVVKMEALGQLGHQQLDWIKKDVSGLPASTPIVLFAHIPLWMVYPDWGWGTADGAQALALLKRFGSVTVLNGHIHQVVQKVEGNVSFHTAMATAFPQPSPGKAPHPGPMVVPAGQLESVLGVNHVNYVPHIGHLAIVDSTLGDRA